MDQSLFFVFATRILRDNFFFLFQELYGTIHFPSIVSLSNFYYLYGNCAPKLPQIPSEMKQGRKKEEN